MRKIKKINGYLVVKFDAREIREWEGTALGEYGVIDAELYTGHLEIDRSAMEYDGAETLEEAVRATRTQGSTLSSYSMIPRRQRSTSASRRYAPPSENRGRKSRSLSRSCAKTQRRTV